MAEDHSSWEWRSQIYKQVKRKTGLEYAEWMLIRNEVIERDRYTCLRCETRYRSKKKLTVHHIVPRAEGGSNDLTNLVTLCYSCHDFVEINDLRSKASIMGSMETSILEIKVEAETAPTDWHTWVYGGARKP